MTVEDEDAVLSELAEIEKMAVDSLALAMPDAPLTTGLETGTHKVLSCDFIPRKIVELIQCN